MEKALFDLKKSVEEKILYVLKDEERSIRWLAKTIDIDYGYLYRVLIGPGSAKNKMTDKILGLIKEVWPQYDFDSNSISQLP